MVSIRRRDALSCAPTMGRTKHIYIAYTGGTIGMRRSDAGWQAGARGSWPQSRWRQMPALSSAEGMPTYEIHEFDSLLDSSNMTPQGWIRIARQDRRELLQRVTTAFIVLHGTDTMAYTASALSMFLAGLDKPVIVTGSQIPLCQPRNDARENLVTALQIAGDDQAPKEVCVYFNDLLLRGCRTTKMDCDGFGAFGSPNVEPLGKIGVYFEYRVAFNRHLFHEHPSTGPRPSCLPERQSRRPTSAEPARRSGRFAAVSGDLHGRCCAPRLAPPDPGSGARVFWCRERSGSRTASSSKR